MLKGNLLSTNGDKSLVSIDWSGYKISDGDELYHTVWDNVEGSTDIKRPSEVPVDAKFDIDSFNFEHIGRAGLKYLTSQPEHWLYTAKIHPDTLQCFLTKEQYEDLCSVENIYNDSDADSDGNIMNDMEKLKIELQRRSKLAATGGV